LHIEDVLNAYNMNQNKKAKKWTASSMLVHFFLTIPHSKICDVYKVTTKPEKL
jgi:hypothetical protein